MGKEGESGEDKQERLGMRSGRFAPARIPPDATGLGMMVVYRVLAVSGETIEGLVNQYSLYDKDDNCSKHHVANVELNLDAIQVGHLFAKLAKSHPAHP
jgi:hypothetical protein